MDFSLNTEQKRTILVSTKEAALNELYSLLIRIGVDPDTFDASQGLSEDDMSIYGERLRIQKLVESISLMESKLTELEV